MFRKPCKHDWKLLSEVVTESQFEHALRVATDADGFHNDIPHQMCQADRKHIQTFSCDKCGKLKRFVESI